MADMGPRERSPISIPARVSSQRGRPAPAGAYKRAQVQVRASTRLCVPPPTRASELTLVGRLVGRRTASLRLQPVDREEIVSAVLERLVIARRRSPDFNGAPEAAVIAQNVDWAVTDFCRAQMRRSARERLTEPELLPERPAAAAPRLGEQGLLRSLVPPLTVREREILFERYVIGLHAHDVADHRGMNTDAVKAACSRAARKAREALQKPDVTFLEPRSVVPSEEQAPLSGPPAGRASTVRTRARSGAGRERSNKGAGTFPSPTRGESE